MEVYVSVEHTYPCLGYVGIVEGRALSLYCGVLVEVRGNRFSDGAWDGEYTTNPTRESFICGSVGVAHEDAVEVFVSQSPTDRVFFFDVAPGKTMFSNSLSLILMEANQDLDPNYISYRSEAISSEVGFSMAPRSLHLRSGHMLGMAINEVLTISALGA